MFHLKTECYFLWIEIQSQIISVPICDEVETGEEHGRAASQSSNNNLSNFQPLQIPSTKSQVPHLIGSSNVQLLGPLPHVPVKESTKQQATITTCWNVTEHTEPEASQSIKSRSKEASMNKKKRTWP